MSFVLVSCFATAHFYRKKWKTFELRIFIGQGYFNNDGAQLYLIFQPIYKTITTFSGLSNIISQWESKGLSKENFNIVIQEIKFFLQNLRVWIILE